MASALDKAYESGVIVCCAAGQVWGEVIYPGRYNRCITMGGVGLHKNTGKLQPWSSAARGQYVDLCAPADKIRRVKAPSFPGSTDVYPEADGDGTSYATAICSGVAALWLAHHDAALTTKYQQPWQIPAAFKKLARETAAKHEFKPQLDENNVSLYGSGSLDAHALLTAKLPNAQSLHQANPAAGDFDRED